MALLSMSDDKPVSFRLSEELRELVEEQADADRVSFSEKVREYLRDGVEMDDEQLNQQLPDAADK